MSITGGWKAPALHHPAHPARSGFQQPPPAAPGRSRSPCGQRSPHHLAALWRASCSTRSFSDGYFGFPPCCLLSPLLLVQPGAQGFGHTIPPISVISSYKAESPGAVLKSCPPCLSTFTAPSLLHPALLPEQGAGSCAHTSSVPLPNHPGATHPLVDPQPHCISPNPFLHPQTLLHSTEQCSHPPHTFL